MRGFCSSFSKRLTLLFFHFPAWTASCGSSRYALLTLVVLRDAQLTDCDNNNNNNRCSSVESTRATTRRKSPLPARVAQPLLLH
jgi:hypothetical protein